MRYLAWLAIFSLQMGMFVCGAGIDVCHAADAPAHVTVSQGDGNQSDSNGIDSICVAHAAHTFLWQESDAQGQIYTPNQRASLFMPFYFSEIFYLIEQPPKHLHS